LNNSDFRNLYSKHQHISAVVDLLNIQTVPKIHLKGLAGSSSSLVMLACKQKMDKPFVVVMSDKEEAAYLYNDLVTLAGEGNVFFFPSAYKRSLAQVSDNTTDNSSVILRTEVLSRFLNQTDELNQSFVITYPEALVEKVITKFDLNQVVLTLNSGEKVDVDFVIELLIQYDFKRVDFVYEPGQYSLRGGIIDIFSFTNDYPYRVDFFGNEVESIRTFDTVTQLSINKLSSIQIIPNIHHSKDNERRISLVEYVSSVAVWWIKDIKYTVSKMDLVYENTMQAMEKQVEEITENYFSGKEFQSALQTCPTLFFGTKPSTAVSSNFQFNVSIQPAFSKNFELLGKDLTEKSEAGFQNLILTDSEKQVERLDAIFKSEMVSHDVKFDFALLTIHEGFVDHDLKICCYTDHQIFERYHKFHLKSAVHAAGKEALTLREISNLQPGDYVVHVDHGIGVFGGLVTTDVNGKQQEVIRLVYKDKDILYVSIHALHRISKYKGKDGEPPRVYKLGSGAWQKLTQRTKAKVKDIAKDLIALYAKRKTEEGFRYSPDSYLQQELEASFIYEDTPDQYKAVAAVKSDMESVTPMDRLVCGDVGFGKTEVAIRAAFKAVTDSKQVAVLVPTTILALQHFKTFSDRLKNFPCKVEYISRLKTAKDQKETLKDLESGKIDIIIGTHRIVSQDVKFKDLGLLIIDEEQKFGVSLKEKLKKLKINVDTLTLTATPIPRTLQFSLMGARDLSIINTPPPNRYPIVTELHTFDEALIRDVINYEIERNGQVFFIHNRIDNIADIQALITRLCPHVRSVFAHGQMDGPLLEKIMLDFINEEYGVLIATTIIESGLDISNANTIIINNAQNFGLSDLHQLRGRVGRSNKKAFCYLLAPPLSMVTSEARRRLTAIETFAELGSGFNIALQDLDIRGAGNILGAEQSGFIADIGFETYQRILNEALIELKESEYKDFYESLDAQNDEENKSNEILKTLTSNKFVSDCLMDTDLEVLFPESYVENIAERMNLYKELDSIENEYKLNEFEQKLIDRFGRLPRQSMELMNVVRLRWLAIDLGIEKIILKKETLICYFVYNQDSPYYQTPIFTAVLNFVQKNPKICKMKESNNKLSLTFDNIKKISQAIELLGKIR